MTGMALLRAQAKTSSGWLVVAVMVGFAVFDALAGEGLVWRYEWQRAVNGAGGYLLVVGPLLVGAGCLEATRARRALTGFRDGLVHRADAAWPGVGALTLMAAVTHALVVLARAVTAGLSGAVGYVWWHAPVVQLLLICGLCALGALVGRQTDSILAGPLLATVGLFAVMSTAVPLLRTVLLAGGGGYFDQSLIGSPVAWTIAVCVTAAAALVLNRPRRLAARVRLVDGLAAAAGVLGLTGVLFLPSELVVANAEVAECVDAADVSVCGPRGTEPLLRPVSEQLDRGAAALAQFGRELPSRDYVLALGMEAPVAGSQVSLPVTASMVRDEHVLVEELLPYMTGAIYCPGFWSDEGPTPEEDQAAVLAATWLRDELGGTVPDGVERLHVGGGETVLIRDVLAALNPCDQQELRRLFGAER